MDTVHRTDWIETDPEATPRAGRLRDNWTFQCLAYLCLIPFIVRMFLIRDSEHTHLALITLPGLPLAYVLASIFAFKAKADNRKLLQYLKSKMDMPGASAQYGVQVVYMKEGTACGLDAGVVTLREGILDFAGRNSHFSIPTSPRPGFSGLHKVRPLDPNRRRCNISLEGDREAIDIHLISKMSNGPSRPAQFFDELIAAQKAPIEEDAHFLLPPSSPNEEVLRLRRSKLRWAVAMAILMPLVCALSAIDRPADALKAALLSLPVGAVLGASQWPPVRKLVSRHWGVLVAAFVPVLIALSAVGESVPVFALKTILAALPIGAILISSQWPSKRKTKVSQPAISTEFVAIAQPEAVEEQSVTG